MPSPDSNNVNSSAFRSANSYRMIGGDGDKAVAAGLSKANWYKCAVPRPVLKDLMQRDDAHAIRDTLLWYALIAGAGILAWFSLGTAWAVPAFLLYGTLYCGPADSRWHECGHGTAFKTRWMNDVVYQMACFQVFRRPTAWRWSHARHHTDTLVVGRDPEISATVPTNWVALVSNIFALSHVKGELPKVINNILGRISEEDKTYIPEMEWPKLVRDARVWGAIYLVVIATAVFTKSWLPVLFIGLPSLYGAWLYHFFGLTQHAGMPENVTDHRLNCRTVEMNPVFRFLYWNMNYHAEHHMFPMVPYHALPRLQEAVKNDMPPPYKSTYEAYAEIIPALIRQTSEPQWHVVRPLPKHEPS
jgi:fatty acid desaturase